MSARDTILAASRATRRSVAPLPDLAVLRQAHGAESTLSLVERFSTMAQATGAQVISTSANDVGRRISDAHPNAPHVLSMIPAVRTTVSSLETPHDASTLDLFVCEGVLGVAENGAVWLPASRLGERAALFLATQVAVVIRAAALVADLHEAYVRLDLADEGFGTFVAGPSKTADIEQSLVIGAHGPKALTVVLVHSTDPLQSPEPRHAGRDDADDGE